MRRYECSLRDEDLQKALDRFTGGDFSKKLSELTFCDIPCRPFSIQIECGEPLVWSKEPRISIMLTGDNLKYREKEYRRNNFNPHGWNDVRDSEPPINKWMMCEFVNRMSGQIERFVAKYSMKGERYRWIDQLGKDDYIVDRFRPWED